MACPPKCLEGAQQKIPLQLEITQSDAQTKKILPSKENLVPPGDNQVNKMELLIIKLKIL